MIKTNQHTAMIDRRRLAALRLSEDRAFEQRTTRSRSLQKEASNHLPRGVPMSWMSGLYRTPPIFIAEGHGASFTDVDGNDYLDFNLCDLSMTIGFGNGAVAAALGAQARRGAHFLLPTEDAIAVSQILAIRMGLPFWQFTLSASGANSEVIRIARFMTERPRIVIFGGHYHGHIEETLVREEDGRSVEQASQKRRISRRHDTRRLGRGIDPGHAIARDGKRIHLRLACWSLGNLHPSLNCIGRKIRMTPRRLQQIPKCLFTEHHCLRLTSDGRKGPSIAIAQNRPDRSGAS